MESDKNVYKCNICDRNLSSMVRLERHLIAKHSEERLYECRTCLKQFVEKSNLTKHVRIHSGERPYVCKTCQKPFARIDTLKVHERTHTGERPYECKTCHKQYIGKKDLTEHLRVHSGIKPFVCTTCNKQFIRKRNLTTHAKTHTRDKTFKCKRCRAVFSCRMHLNIHYDTRTEETCVLKEKINDMSTDKSGFPNDKLYDTSIDKNCVLEDKSLEIDVRIKQEVTEDDLKRTEFSNHESNVKDSEGPSNPDFQYEVSIIKHEIKREVVEENIHNYQSDYDNVEFIKKERDVE